MSRKISILIVLAVIVFGGLFFYQFKKRQNTAPTPLPPTAITYTEPAEVKTEDSKAEAEQPLPSSLLIKVPFATQAPNKNWDELHNQACEEANAIMVHAYFGQIKSLSPEMIDAEIAKLTAWQDQNFGYHLSVTTQEVAKMIRSVYKLNAEIVPMSEDTIKRALAGNKLVIWPGNGRLINNPYYKTPGPIYHMMLITGYNDKGLITNDPGTNTKGENYQYPYDILFSANGTWNHERNEVDLTQKNIIIVSN